MSSLSDSALPLIICSFMWLFYNQGTDEKAIVDILGNRSNAQRQKLLVQYKASFGRVGMLK